MKRTALIVLTLVVVSSILVSACGGQPSDTGDLPPSGSDTSGEQTTSEPQATINPNTVSATIGADGGTIASIDGLVEFIVPEGSITESITVNLTMIESEGDDPRFLTPTYDVDVIGAPDEFGWLPMLSFPGAAAMEDIESLVFATNLTIAGDFDVEGEVPDDLQYWVPLTDSLVVQGSSLLLPMWHFSPYRVFQMDIGPICLPDMEMLDPPAPPDDYFYVGVVVVINDVYNEEYSSLPPDHAETEGGKVLGFRYLDEATDCEILVLHWYKPLLSDPTPTPDPGGGGWPPQPPGQVRINPPDRPCWVYLGHEIYFRFAKVWETFDFDKWLNETVGFDFRFEIGRDIQPPGFNVVYIYAPKSCDDMDECTTDWCDPLTGNCEHDEIPDCEPAECYCNEDCIITSAGCTWDDANECSGLHSACDYEGIIPPYKSGQTCCWGSCCITIQCP